MLYSLLNAKLPCWLPMNGFSDDDERINIKEGIERDEERTVQVQIHYCYRALHGILWFHCILSMELFLTQLGNFRPLLSSEPGLSNPLSHIQPVVPAL